MELATPGSWTFSPMVAWVQDSPTFSFAQGPCEVVDTRLDIDGEPQVPVVVGKQTRWGELKERSVACSTFEFLAPDALLGVFDVVREEELVGFNQHDLDFNKNLKGARRTAYACCIYSPVPQDVSIGTFWGECWLNGERLDPENDEVLGNRQNVSLCLKEGWNFLFGSVEQLEEVLGFFIGVPRGLGLCVRGGEALDDGVAMRYSLPFLKDDFKALFGDIPGCFSELEGLDVSWNEVFVEDSVPQNPARIRAWDCVKGSVKEGAVFCEGARTWVYEYKGEFDGYLSVEVDAPVGTILDVGVDDWLADGGLIDLYGSNPFINSVDRYILKGGVQCVQGFHVRGGHYLQVTLTLPEGCDAEGVLRDVHVVSANSPLPAEGAFECSDVLFNWVWKTSARTLQVSVEDSYADCPWRERGTYMGDSFVNVHMHAALNRDWRVMPRVIRLFADSQYESGQMPSAAPSWMVDAHADFTLIWVKVLRDYYRLSRDVELLREMWPALERIFESSVWVEHESGLWNADEDMRVFIDWGVLEDEQLGFANAALNAFRIDSLECAAELAEALALTERAEAFAEEARSLRCAFSVSLWVASEGRYAASISEEDGSLAETSALHANVLALLYGIGSEEQLAGVLSYVKNLLDVNLSRMKGASNMGQVELYFMFYTLQALYQNDCVEYAENLVREHYTVMMERDTGTLWEGLHCGLESRFSRCHSWGGGPMVYASSYILGVQFPDPRDLNKVRIAPQVETIDWARGVYPHQRGDITVSWTRLDGDIELEYTLPEGVELVV